MSDKSPEKILRFLARNKDKLSPLLILTHDYPDPDALASAFAFQHLAAHSYGIRSRIAYGGVIGRTENREMVRILKLPVYKLRSSDLKKYANIALVDTQPAFGNNSFPKNRKATIVIDQHPSITKPAADLVIVDTKSGATSVLLAQALLMQGLKIHGRVATALVYGILSDTLNLYRVNRKDVIETYLTLLPRCDVGALARIQNPSRSRRFFATLVKGIKNAVIRRDLIVSNLGFVENPDLVSQIADFLLTCEGIRWSFCTGRYKGNLHISLRTAIPDGAAGETLRALVLNRGQAGGHGAIAGGQLNVGEGAEEMIWRGTEFLLTDRLLKQLGVSGKRGSRVPVAEKILPEGKKS